MEGWRPAIRLRERLVLGHLRGVLARDERVAIWAHVQASEDRRFGVAALTPRRCLFHWSAHGHDDVSVAWHDVSTWRVEHRGKGGPVLTLETADGAVVVRLPATSRQRARRATALLHQVTVLAGPPGDAHGTDLEVDRHAPIVTAERRGWRGHTRRVAVTVAGVLMILLGVAFATPVVPGPGMLTILAGLAILATEYDWARDAHHWLKRKVDRMIAWWRSRRRRAAERRTGRAAPSAVPAPPIEPRTASEASRAAPDNPAA